MTAIADQLLKAILQLPPDEREQIADQVYQSLDDETDIELDAEWSEEIRRRVEDARSGRVKGIPWEEARKQIFAEDNDDS